MSAHLDALVRELADALSPEDTENVRLRKAVVFAQSPLTVKIGGSDVAVPVQATGPIPANGTVVWVLESGPRRIMLDTHRTAIQSARMIYPALQVFDGTSWSPEYTHTIDLGRYDDGIQTWRRIATVDMPIPPSTPSYTGATMALRVWNGINSWGQNTPAQPYDFQINFVSSTPGTTSNASTAQIFGDWRGVDLVRVWRVGGTHRFYVEAQLAGNYQTLKVEARMLSLSGEGTVTFEHPQGPVPSTIGSEGVGGGPWYVASSHYGLEGNSRGWQPFPTNTSSVNNYNNDMTTWQPRYIKRNGIVYMAGLWTGGAIDGRIVGTLPGGYRPYGIEMFNAINSGSSHRMDIYPDGRVIIHEPRAGAGTAWISATCSFASWN